VSFEVESQLDNMPTRLIRILARKHGLDDDESVATLRRKLAEIDNILEDEEVTDPWWK